MELAHLTYISLASFAAARAFIQVGKLEYTHRWLNFPIAWISGYAGAIIGLAKGGPQEWAFLLSIFFSIAALAGYQWFRINYGIQPKKRNQMY